MRDAIIPYRVNHLSLSSYTIVGSASPLKGYERWPTRTSTKASFQWASLRRALPSSFLCWFPSSLHSSKKLSIYSSLTNLLNYLLRGRTRRDPRSPEKKAKRLLIVFSERLVLASVFRAKTSNISYRIFYLLDWWLDANLP